MIIFTAHAQPDLLALALRAGASGYVLKSAPAEDIAKAVKAVTKGGTFLGGDFAGGKPSEVEKLLDLSPRERQILELLAEGLRVKEIADRLALSPATVHTHVRNAIAKLEVDTRPRRSRWRSASATSAPAAARRATALSTERPPLSARIPPPETPAICGLSLRVQGPLVRKQTRSCLELPHARDAGAEAREHYLTLSVGPRGSGRT